MAIPDYQTFMLPLLKFTADGREHRTRDATEAMAEYFGITEEEKRQMLPSGSQRLYRNRAGWAFTYLRQAGLLESTKRGWVSITDTGKQLLAKQPDKIDLELLKEYPKFQDFLNRPGNKERASSAKIDLDELFSKPLANAADTLDEQIQAAWKELQKNLQAELLDQIKSANASFFEYLVVDLLVSMGYGGSRADAGQAVGRSGDEGIDGVIKEDPLGLDMIYLQAKRWEGQVGRPEIQKFAGALQGKRAKKGVFITTSTFSREAVDYADSIDTKIILIDGDRLTQLMVDHDVGVSLSDTYPVKRVDTDYFSED